MSIEPMLAVRPLSYMELRPDGRAIALLYNKGATWTQIYLSYTHEGSDTMLTRTPVIGERAKTTGMKGGANENVRNATQEGHAIGSVDPQ